MFGLFKAVTSRAVTVLKANKATTKFNRRGLFLLPKLPFKIDRGLAPFLSPEQIHIHYNKIHMGYVVKANQLVEPTMYELLPLEDVIRRSSRKVDEAMMHSYCSQVWNHNFMWFCMTSKKNEPSAFLMDAFRLHFNGFDKFKQTFAQFAMALHGCGYTWLVDNDGQWEIVNTFDTETVISTPGITPLLILDLWEHAYFGDYEDRRAEYIENWFKVVNWAFVEDQFLKIDRHAQHLYE